MGATVDASPPCPSPLADLVQHLILVQQVVASCCPAGYGDGDGNEGYDSLPSDQLHHLLTGLDKKLAALGEHKTTDASSLSWACQKVGRDLSLKLGRFVQDGVTGANPEWPVEDVEALRDRLVQLKGHFPGANFSPLRPVRPRHPSASQALPREEEHHGTDDKRQAKLPRRSKVGGGLVSIPPPAKASDKPRLAPATLLFDFILESLAYGTMRDREEEVVQAHSQTFDWVFQEQQLFPGERGDEAHDVGSHLTTWLATDSMGPIYWVTGKPGSGKSTFMRYLFEHERTRLLLQRWSGDKPVAVAGFFFWTSGSREQRSQTGMMRSLLHQLLLDNKELIPATFPDLWSRLRVMTTAERIRLSLEWPVDDLLCAFRRLTDAALPAMNICLLVDGLDEFDGDHMTMINFFRRLGQGKHAGAVKMCLSSRPWSVFEEAFERAVPHLKLQHLTRDDMLRYVGDKLREDGRMRRALDQRPQTERALLDATVRRADGVFLWVRLAVGELMARWDAQTASAEDLMSVLQALPDNLDDLFAKLLFRDHQSPSELAQTAMLFRLIRAREVVADFVRDDSASSLTVWELAFALHAEDDEAATTWQVEEADDELISSRCRDATHHITYHSARLLDTHPRPTRRQDGGKITRMPRGLAGGGGYDDDNGRHARITATHRVTYIHRTVRDWLMESCAGIMERSPSAWPEAGVSDAHLRLLRSYVLRLKRPRDEIEHHRRLDEWWPDMVLALTHARYVRDDAGSLQRRFVNELDKTMGWHWLKRPGDRHDHWARSAFGSYEVRAKAPPIRRPFLCLATRFGLTRYVGEELEAEGTRQQQGACDDDDDDDDDDEPTPLLAYATEFMCSRQRTIFPLSDPRLVNTLLCHPGRGNPGPNETYADFGTRRPMTAWIAILRHLRDARRRGFIEHYDTNPDGTRRWAEIVRLFLETGFADPGAVIVADRWDPETTAAGVLASLDETYGAVEVRELTGLLARLLGKKNGEVQ